MQPRAELLISKTREKNSGRIRNQGLELQGEGEDRPIWRAEIAL